MKHLGEFHFNCFRFLCETQPEKEVNKRPKKGNHNKDYPYNVQILTKQNILVLFYMLPKREGDSNILLNLVSGMLGKASYKSNNFKTSTYFPK